MFYYRSGNIEFLSFTPCSTTCCGSVPTGSSRNQVPMPDTVGTSLIVYKTAFSVSEVLQCSWDNHAGEKKTSPFSHSSFSPSIILYPSPSKTINIARLLCLRSEELRVGKEC